MEIIACGWCGAKTKYLVKGSTQGLYCTECEWAVIGSYFPKITQDRTQYKIFLVSADASNEIHIKAIAMIANINFLQAKALIQQYYPLIIEDEAIAINKIKKILDRLSIGYEIVPEFTY